MFKIVYFVEWIENGIERSVWFLSYESAVRFAEKVGGVIDEKDVS